MFYAILYGLPNKIQCIHLFMSLFIIPSQSVFGKSFAKPLAKTFRKISISKYPSQKHNFPGAILFKCQDLSWKGDTIC